MDGSLRQILSRSPDRYFHLWDPRGERRGFSVFWGAIAARTGVWRGRGRGSDLAL